MYWPRGTDRSNHLERRRGCNTSLYITKFGTFLTLADTFEDGIGHISHAALQGQEFRIGMRPWPNSFGQELTNVPAISLARRIASGREFGGFVRLIGFDYADHTARIHACISLPIRSSG